MTSKLLVRLLKSGAEAVLRDPRSPAALAGWREGLQGTVEAEPLMAARKRILEGLLAQLRAAEGVDWEDVGLRLGVPDPDSHFAAVQRDVRAALRAARNLQSLWGPLVDAFLGADSTSQAEGLSKEVLSAVGVRSAEDQWVLEIKRMGAGSQAVPSPWATEKVAPLGPPVATSLPPPLPFGGARRL